MHYQHDNSEDGNLIHSGEGVKHGTSLDLLLDGKPMVLSVCLEILAYVADILTETDKLGRFHGELTLENIKITPDGAVIVDGYPEAAGFSSITPEKAITSIASDTYALGLIMIGLLAGHNRFKIPKEEDRHDDQIARIILSLDWQELANQIWIENIQDFLVDTLSFFPSERPHPLDIANVLFELLPFTHGPNLKLYAAEKVSKPNVSYATKEKAKPTEEWGEAVAIEAPVLKSVSIVPDSSQGAATGLWSRQKIAQMFNGELKSEERARREVWKPQEFDEDSGEESEFVNSKPAEEPPPGNLPALPDLPPLDGFEMPNPIDNPDFFKTSKASLSVSQNNDPIPFSAFEDEKSEAENTIPPPPPPTKGSSGYETKEPPQIDRQPETAPLSDAGQKSHSPPVATVSISQSSPSIGLNIPTHEKESANRNDYPPRSGAETLHSKSVVWPLTILGFCVLLCSGVLGVAYFNQDQLRQFFSPVQEVNSTDKATVPTPEDPPITVENGEQEAQEDNEENNEEVTQENSLEDPKENREPKPKAPPIATTNQNTASNSQQTPSSNSNPTPSSNSNPTPSSSSNSTSTASTTSTSNSTASQSTTNTNSNPTNTEEATPTPTIPSGSIRATITGISGKVSCGDGQQLEIESSVTIEFETPQACRLESNGERGAILIQQSGTYTCRSNNGAIECN